jgi:hypothetical protein
LLNSLNFISFLGNFNGASEFSGTTTSDDIAVSDHVPDYAEGVMDASLGFIADSSAASSHEDGHGLGFSAVLDQDDLIVGGSEGDFLDETGLS